MRNLLLINMKDQDTKLIFESYLKEDMYSDRFMHIDKYNMRGKMEFIDEDLIEAIQQGYYQPVISGMGVSIYDAEESMVVLPIEHDPKRKSDTE